MANCQSIAIPKASKCTPVNSAHKHAAKENAAADKLKCAEKKATMKACKELCAETVDDNLLVRHEGESPDFQKLHDLSLWLEAKNKCLKAKIQHCDERDTMPMVKTVPEPQNKGEVDIETIHGHLNLNSEENNVEWSMLRASKMKCTCPNEDDKDKPGEDTSNKRARLAKVHKAVVH
ncbi:hypothetical protein FRC11_005536 [Ceratobasidium sp. 423]|nr:hypothetical protein FRC11_005536 [Ceratobasidium sp. 423]